MAGLIPSAAVAYANIQNVAASRIVGNPTGSAAAPSEISLAGGLAFSGTTLTAAGALTPTSVAATGAVTSTGAITSSSATAGAGYATGAGGTVTQITSKATGVTLNKICGAITLHNASLAANTVVSFTLTNSAIAADDDVRVWVKSGNAGAGTYRVGSEGNASGSRTIVVENKTAGALAEAIVLGFNVLKVVVA